MKKIIKGIFILIIAVCLVGCKRDISRTKNLDVFKITTKSGEIVELQYEEMQGFSIKIPTKFNIMPDETIKIKYPLESRPDTVYTNDETSINLAVTFDNSSISNDEIKEFTHQMSEMFKQIGTLLSVEVFVRDTHNIGELKVLTKAVDTNIYNHIIFFSIDGEIKMLNFNYTENYHEDWEEISDLIINSIQFD